MAILAPPEKSAVPEFFFSPESFKDEFRILGVVSVRNFDFLVETASVRLYTSKELDEDTQLYYFGARYLDPRTSVWQSADPILEKYLPTGDEERDANLPWMGGVFNSHNLGLYLYGHQNPVKHVDPDGSRLGPQRHDSKNRQGLYKSLRSSSPSISSWTLPEEYGGFRERESLFERFSKGLFDFIKSMIEDPLGSISFGATPLAKRGLKIVQRLLGKISKSGTNKKFLISKTGGIQRGTSLKGYRLDKAHPGNINKMERTKSHINFWDYTGTGKQSARNLDKMRESLPPGSWIKATKKGYKGAIPVE